MTSEEHPAFTERSLRFLAELERNNDTAWFDAHRATYEEAVQAPMEALLLELTGRLSDAPVPLRGSRSTMFRINRDVRFTPDKRPYNTTASALLTPSGTKAEDAGLLYLQLGAGGGFVAAGLHAPTPRRLAPLRDRIVEDPRGFDRLLGRLAEADLQLDTDAHLTTMPRGYGEHSDHPLAWALRLTTFIVRRPLPASAWLSGEVGDRVERVARGAGPLLEFVRTGA